MKKKLVVILSQLLALNRAQGQELFIRYEELSKLGFDKNLIINEFLKHGTTLNNNDILRVSSDEEGNHINFENLDSYSIDIPIELSRAPLNKIDTSG